MPLSAPASTNRAAHQPETTRKAFIPPPVFPRIDPQPGRSIKIKQQQGISCCFFPHFSPRRRLAFLSLQPSSVRSDLMLAIMFTRRSFLWRRSMNSVNLWLTCDRKTRRPYVPTRRAGVASVSSEACKRWGAGRLCASVSTLQHHIIAFSLKPRQARERQKKNQISTRRFARSA